MHSFEYQDKKSIGFNSRSTNYEIRFYTDYDSITLMIEGQYQGHEVVLNFEAGEHDLSTKIRYLEYSLQFQNTSVLLTTPFLILQFEDNEFEVERGNYTLSGVYNRSIILSDGVFELEYDHFDKTVLLSTSTGQVLLDLEKLRYIIMKTFSDLWRVLCQNKILLTDHFDGHSNFEKFIGWKNETIYTGVHFIVENTTFGIDIIVENITTTIAKVILFNADGKLIVELKMHRKLLDLTETLKQKAVQSIILAAQTVNYIVTTAFADLKAETADFELGDYIEHFLTNSTRNIAKITEIWSDGFELEITNGLFRILQAPYITNLISSFLQNWNFASINKFYEQTKFWTRTADEVKLYIDEFYEKTEDSTVLRIPANKLLLETIFDDHKLTRLEAVSLFQSAILTLYERIANSIDTSYRQLIKNLITLSHPIPHYAYGFIDFNRKLAITFDGVLKTVDDPMDILVLGNSTVSYDDLFNSSFPNVTFKKLANGEWAISAHPILYGRDLEGDFGNFDSEPENREIIKMDLECEEEFSCYDLIDPLPYKQGCYKKAFDFHCQKLLYI